jgi:Xaa-Pro aminopeptidase
MPFNGERAFEVMQKHGVDAVIASSTENVYYLSDYWCIGKNLGCGVDAYTLLPIKGQPAVVAPLSEADLVYDSGTWIGDLRFYGESGVDLGDPDEPSELTERLLEMYKNVEPSTDGITSILKALKDNNLTKGSLGLDTTGLTPVQYEYLIGKLPDANIVDGSKILREIRMVKTKPELDFIIRATEITEKSMEDVLEIVRSEITELDLAGMFSYSVAYDGGKVTQNMIGIGERSAYPNPVPSTYEAKRRDLVRLTLGCEFNHYHSNISRTAVIGRPLQKAQRRWEAVQSAQEAAFEMMAPGVKVSEVYVALRKELSDANVRDYNLSLGHSIGVECNEPPQLCGDCDIELEAGMILNVDVPVLEMGFGGVQIEDTVIITPEGCGLLTKTERTLYML